MFFLSRFVAFSLIQGPLGNASLLRLCWNPANCRHGVVPPCGASSGARTWNGILSLIRGVKFFLPKFWDPTNLPIFFCFLHFEVLRGWEGWVIALVVSLREDFPFHGVQDLRFEC